MEKVLYKSFLVVFDQVCSLGILLRCDIYLRTIWHSETLEIHGCLGYV